MTTIATSLVIPFVQAPAGKLAEKIGFNTALSDRWEAIMGFLSNLTSNPWYIFAAAFSAGLAIGVWMDSLLRRRETIPEHPEIDREQLAAQADNLSQNVSELLGDFTERVAIAQNDDFNALREGQRRGGLRDNQADVTARAINSFHAKYNSEFWTIIALAQKCISLDHGDLWQVSHGMGYHDIQKVPGILAKIAISLRYPGHPDIPLRLPQFPGKAVTNPQVASPPVPGRPTSPGEM